jgi:hypothetical protein
LKWPFSSRHSAGELGCPGRIGACRGNLRASIKLVEFPISTTVTGFEYWLEDSMGVIAVKVCKGLYILSKYTTEVPFEF